MIDYRKLYLQLFNRVSDAITQLQEALEKAEESYMEDADETVERE